MLKVTCAIIIKDGKVLVTQRDVISNHPLQWEFPGGKINKEESASECIVREIKEELDLEIEIHASMKSINYKYNFNDIELIPFLTSIKGGKLKLNEHKDFKWVSMNKLLELDLLEADRKLVQQMDNLNTLEEYIGKQMNKT